MRSRLILRSASICDPNHSVSHLGNSENCWDSSCQWFSDLQETCDASVWVDCKVHLEETDQEDVSFVPLWGQSPSDNFWGVHSLYSSMPFLTHRPSQGSLRSQYQSHFWGTFVYTPIHLFSTPYTVISMTASVWLRRSLQLCISLVSSILQCLNGKPMPVRSPVEAALEAARKMQKLLDWSLPRDPVLLCPSPDRDLLPHSQTTFCHISPQTRFPCKPNILQPLLSSSVFIFPSQARLT